MNPFFFPFKNLTSTLKCMGPRAYKTAKLKSPERKASVIPYRLIQPHHIMKRQLENICPKRRRFSLLSLLLTHSQPLLVRSSARAQLSILTLSGRTLNSLTLNFTQTAIQNRRAFSLKNTQQCKTIQPCRMSA